MRAKAFQEGHRTRLAVENDLGLPVIQFDYAFFKVSPGPIENPDNLEVIDMDESEEGWKTTLVAIDCRSSYLFAVSCRKKGPDPYVVDCAISWLKRHGHKACVLQSDGETPIVSLLNAIAEKRTPTPTDTRTTPRGSSDSNGKVEVQIRTLGGQVRALLSTILAGAQVKVLHDMVIFPWLVRHLS